MSLLGGGSSSGSRRRSRSPSLTRSVKIYPTNEDFHLEDIEDDINQLITTSPHSILSPMRKKLKTFQSSSNQIAKENLQNSSSPSKASKIHPLITWTSPSIAQILSPTFAEDSFVELTTLTSEQCVVLLTQLGCQDVEKAFKSLPILIQGEDLQQIESITDLEELLIGLDLPKVRLRGIVKKLQSFQENGVPRHFVKVNSSKRDLTSPQPCVVFSPVVATCTKAREEETRGRSRVKSPESTEVSPKKRKEATPSTSTSPSRRLKDVKDHQDFHKKQKKKRSSKDLPYLIPESEEASLLGNAFVEEIIGNPTPTLLPTPMSIPLSAPVEVHNSYEASPLSAKYLLSTQKSLYQPPPPPVAVDTSAVPYLTSIYSSIHTDQTFPIVLPTVDAFDGQRGIAIHRPTSSLSLSSSASIILPPHNSSGSSATRTLTPSRISSSRASTPTSANGLRRPPLAAAIPLVTSATSALPIDHIQYPNAYYKGQVMISTSHADGLVRHGFGKMTFTNGEIYEGDWHTNQRHGKGTYTWSSTGTQYIGEWQHDQMHGRGRYIASNGDTYEGEYLQDQKHGYGRYTHHATGDLYEGYWLHGKKHGPGIMHFYSKQERYQGAYLNNVKHGHGSYHYASGSIYEGEWEADQKHGYGVMAYANGKIRKGTWHCGKFIHSDLS